MEPTFTTCYFYRAARGNVTPGHQTCAVCGLPTAETSPLGSVLRPTFTDANLLRRPETRVVCPACVYYFDHQELRRVNWWLTASDATAVERRDLRELLTAHLADPPDADGYYLITTSKRKHLALRAPLNLAGSVTRRVQFETTTLSLDAALWRSLTAACDALRRCHTWQEILSDNYQAWRLGKWSNAVEFAAARDIVRPYTRTAYLDLVKFCGDPAAKEDDIDTE